MTNTTAEDPRTCKSPRDLQRAGKRRRQEAYDRIKRARLVKAEEAAAADRAQRSVADAAAEAVHVRGNILKRAKRVRFLKELERGRSRC